MTVLFGVQMSELAAQSSVKMIFHLSSHTLISSSRSSMSVAVSPLRKVYGSCISTDRSSSSALMYLASRSMGFARPSRIRILDLHHITETRYKWSNHMYVWKHYTSEERDLSLACCRWKLSSCSAHVLKCSASFSLCSISSSCSRMDFSRSRSRRSCFTWTHRSHSFTSVSLEFIYQEQHLDIKTF